MTGFEAFFAAVNDGAKPYPWQRALAERLAAGEPPTVIAVPTGAGKTAAVDALVWALACQADRAAVERTVGVRTIWAIDRRILVDAVHSRAVRLAARLASAADDERDPLFPLASALQSIAGPGSPPLAATRWRGGIELERALHGPLQPEVITSTVGQAASRLLFRGYGVGEGSRALAAGLAAADATICLDEAHLAGPFRDTVAAVAGRRSGVPDPLELPGVRTLELTATPQHDVRDADVVRLSDDDWRDERLRQRLLAPKRASLRPGSEKDADQVQTLVEAVREHLKDGAGTVACVVNTVRRAFDVRVALKRAIARDPELSAEHDGEGVACALLVGPQRPVDRRDQLSMAQRLFAPADAGQRVVCVATQTFEVGLDADADALVTESASAAALVQRLGRLNRSGRLDGAGCGGRATIVRGGSVPLYGDDEPRAWGWLEEMQDVDGRVDVSVAALARRPPPPSQHTASAPTLSDEIVEQLVQTDHRVGDYQQVDVEVFWRGAETRPDADVHVCWRGDLLPALRSGAADGYRELLLEAAPPQRDELLPLSLAATRALIAATYRPRGSAAAARLALGDADVEGEGPGGAVEYAAAASVVPFLVVRPSRVARAARLGSRRRVLHGTLDRRDPAGRRGRADERVRPYELLPGDVVVLPARGTPPVDGLPHDDRAGDVAGPAAGAERSAGAGPSASGEPAGQQRAFTDAALPAPVRVSPCAFAAAGTPLDSGAWRRIARACARVEARMFLVRARGRPDAAIDVLLDGLAAAVPGHAGIAALAAAVRSGTVKAALQPVTGAAAGGTPRYGHADDDRLDGDGDGAREAQALVDGVWSDETDEEQADARLAPDRDEDPEDAVARTLTSWVLTAVPSQRRDQADRPAHDGSGPPTLAAHTAAVVARVEQYGALLGLPAALSETLRLAARAHDLGKADPRRQALFRSGVPALGAPLLAKSEFGAADVRAERIARDLSGCPRELRHEASSATIVADALASGRLVPPGEVDGELLLYLVLAHHGRAKPLVPVPRGGRPPAPFHVELDGIAGSADGDASDGWEHGRSLDRFWRIQRRYGAWGLAYVEAVLMLADRTVSAEGR